jgi:fibronectin type 3 domain-containing protein
MYHYVVTAVDQGGLESTQSSQVSATPLNISAPDPPVSLTATAGDGVVNLDWPNSPEVDIAGYTVYRSATSGGPYSAITGSLLTSSSHADSGVVNGTTYHYVVTATDTAAQESGQSPEAQATPADMTPPSPPTGLAAVAGDAVVDLDWDDHVESDVQGYHVYRATQSGGPYARLTGAFITVSAYQDSSVVNGLTYHYAVTALDDWSTPNESARSAEVSAAPEDSTPPVAPSGVSATANGESIDLDWNDNAEGDLAGYSVLRGGQSGGPYTALNDAPLVSSSYADLTAPSGVPQFYVITATDTMDNVSPQSVEVSATAQDITPPAVPTGLTATPSALSVTLHWNLGLEGDLAGYHVERSSTSGGAATRLTSALITETTYTDQGVLPPASVYYTIIAVDTAGNESASSTEASATPLPAPLGLSIH